MQECRRLVQVEHQSAHPNLLIVVSDGEAGVPEDGQHLAIRDVDPCLELIDAERPRNLGETLQHPGGEPMSVEALGDDERHLPMRIVGALSSACGHAKQGVAALCHQRDIPGIVDVGNQLAAPVGPAGRPQEPEIPAVIGELREERMQTLPVGVIRRSQSNGRAVAKDDVDGRDRLGERVSERYRGRVAHREPHVDKVTVQQCCRAGYRRRAAFRCAARQTLREFSRASGKISTTVPS